MKNNKTKSANPKPKYQAGDEFIYTNGKDTMERVSILKVTENGYLLSNRVEVDEFLRRRDAKSPCTLYPADERHTRMYEAYGALFALERAINEIQEEMGEMDPYNLTLDQCDRIISVNKKVQRTIRV